MVHCIGEMLSGTMDTLMYIMYSTAIDILIYTSIMNMCCCTTTHYNIMFLLNFCCSVLLLTLHAT